LLKLQGFAVPEHAFISHEIWLQDERAAIEHIKATIPAPWIVKPHDDGCSVFVSKVSNDTELENAIHALFAAGKSAAFVEECITGMELTVGVIGNAQPCALPPSKAVAVAGILSIEEKFLPGAGENQTPAPLARSALELVMRFMEAAYVAVGCKGYCRIDCFYQSPEQSPTDQERVVFLEFNTLPALTPATCIFHQAAEVGMRPMDFIDLIVQLGLEEHGKLTNPLALQTEIVNAKASRQRLFER
jgi:D-alanine-D-alanine ligase